MRQNLDIEIKRLKRLTEGLKEISYKTSLDETSVILFLKDI